VDSAGAVMLRYSGSPDFPTQNAFQGSQEEASMRSLPRFDTNASGAASLLFSTYLGAQATTKPMASRSTVAEIMSISRPNVFEQLPVLNPAQPAFGGSF